MILAVYASIYGNGKYLPYDQAYGFIFVLSAKKNKKISNNNNKRKVFFSDIIEYYFGKSHP